MSIREGQRSKDVEGELGKTFLPNGKSLHLRCLWAVRARLLLLIVMLAAGAVLLSCSGSAGNANSEAKASPTRPPVPSPAPNSSSGGASPSVPPNAAANAVPKQPQLAEPKKIIPAPTVVASGEGPRIAFTNEELDFGNVPFEDVIRAPFEFKNVGNEPLKILKTQVEVVEGC
ncbi:MAG: hypothetical protein M1358_10185 [Chloroflexi bacterium]|nr:hypothetical protein [Chloroflexota bacterium]